MEVMVDLLLRLPTRSKELYVSPRTESIRMVGVEILPIIPNGPDIFCPDQYVVRQVHSVVLLVLVHVA